MELNQRHKTSAVVLHWLSGVLILFVLTTGSLVLSDIPNTMEKISSFRVHMILGIAITILTIIRITVIVKSKKLEPLKVSKFRAKLIKFNHIAIYVVLLLIGLSGILLAKGSGLGEIVFFGSNTELYNSFKDYSVGIVHRVLTKVLLFLIVMHIVGILSYKFKTKECVLKRMWFSSK
ncbi:cytochrome b/b6 domain-containing protein [Halarcobacter anaerophilus]|jgi:cytochrome b561|uniref:cytochrome b/b6 domain-containing protein n=1 Tax=Halarcobacter anaerophilus TaxID=877500 RepID=UPI0005CA4212|nr:cytochrome b/b6 domain-containing protein [Halarcobacter anaerophilus]